MATPSPSTRILVLAHVFPRTLEDSMGAFLLHLVDALAARGIASTVVAPHAAGLARTETLGSACVHRFRYAPERWEQLAYAGTMHEFVARGIFSKLLFMAFNFAFLLKGLQAARASGARIIHAHWCLPDGFVGALLSLMVRRPLVITTHGTDVEILRRTRWASPLARWTFSRARVVTCGSTYLREQLLSLGVADPARVVVIPMPVNSQFTTHNQELGNTEYAIRMMQYPIRNIDLQLPILTVSRLTAQKSIDTLIAAVALLRERGCPVRLTIVGDGPEREGLQGQARDLGIPDILQFAGALPQAQLLPYYSSCSVFVLPSVHEGMGLVLAEALLCGAPVIAVNSGGVTDIVRDGETGLLVPEKDAAALANAIQKLLDNPTLAQQLAARGAAWVLEHFAPERVAAQFAETYALAH